MGKERAHPRLVRGAVVLLGAKGLHVVISRHDGQRHRIALVLCGIEQAPTGNVGKTEVAPPWAMRSVDRVEAEYQAVADAMLALHRV